MREFFQRYDAMVGLAIMFAAIVWGGIAILEKPAPPPRYTIIGGGQPGLVYRLDTATGAMWMCGGSQCQPVVWSAPPASTEKPE